LNIYTIQFFSNCPNNGMRIQYDLRIESETPIRVENIFAEIDRVEDLFHEEMAYQLSMALPGRHTLSANHHGVHITTLRGGVAV
jgi:hypothetical protein